MTEERIVDDEPTIDSEPESNWVPALIVLSGKDEGLKVEVKSSPFIIGRSGGSNLILKEKAVSRKHASVEMVDGRFVIRDLGSTWGMRIAGEKIREGRLSYGDEIEVAGVRLRFDLAQRESLTRQSRWTPVRVALAVFLLLALLSLAAVFHYHRVSQRLLDRPGGDVLSQIIYHYDKGVLHYGQIHIDPGNRKKAIEEMNEVIKLDPEGKTQFSRSARRIIDGLDM